MRPEVSSITTIPVSGDGRRPRAGRGQGGRPVPHDARDAGSACGTKPVDRGAPRCAAARFAHAGGFPLPSGRLAQRDRGRPEAGPRRRRMLSIHSIAGRGLSSTTVRHQGRVMTGRRQGAAPPRRAAAPCRPAAGSRLRRGRSSTDTRTGVLDRGWPGARSPRADAMTTSAPRDQGPSRVNTVFPALIVSITLMSLISIGATFSGLRSRTTRSAILPGSSDPFLASSNSM